MNESRAPRAMIWTGPVFAVLFLVVGFMTGDVPSDKASAAKLLTYYHDHKTTQMVTIFLTPLAAALLVLFAAQLVRRARAADERTTGASVLFGGAVLWAAGMLIGSMVTVAQVDAADKKQGEASVALNMLSNATWLPFIAGIAVFLIGAGMTALGTHLLPKWLGWLALVVGVVSLAGPGGFVGFFGAPAWLLITGIVLAVRDRAQSSSAPSHAASGNPVAVR
jgi:hypothetical protein